ncbi:MAG: Gfo/Idh/MocA family oxidoreductase, partial [Calditrichota bacterium]
MGEAKIRWGILSTGSIANTFAEALNNIPDAYLAAVASRNLDNAESFADKHQVENAFGSYKELAEADDVDVIYIGTPHIFHHRDARLCLEAGKNVLCEKAFTINAAEARDIVQLARSKSLFLMEAMWNRYMPSFEKVRSLLADGTIGELKRMH